jgi:hypothetical protein
VEYQGNQLETLILDRQEDEQKRKSGQRRNLLVSLTILILFVLAAIGIILLLNRAGIV